MASYHSPFEWSLHFREGDVGMLAFVLTGPLPVTSFPAIKAVDGFQGVLQVDCRVELFMVLVLGVSSSLVSINLSQKLRKISPLQCVKEQIKFLNENWDAVLG